MLGRNLKDEVKRDMRPSWSSSCSSAEALVAFREEKGESPSHSSFVGLPVFESGGDDMLIRKDGGSWSSSKDNDGRESDWDVESNDCRRYECIITLCAL
jgi:hypothetical protein